MTSSFNLLKTEILARLGNREQIYDQGILNRWAAVHLILQYDNCWQIAMIKRVENPNDPWSGHYAFPGGRVENGESHRHAAIRETEEEVGLHAGQSDYLGQFYSFQIKVENKPINFGISAHLSVAEGSAPAFTPQEDEVESAYWLKLSDLLNPENITSQNFRGFTGNFYRPCIKFDGHVIWGISYFILKELVDQLSGLKLEESLILNPDILPAN